MMPLSEFITIHREAIVTRTAGRVRDRPSPSVSATEVEHGVPMFLTQLSETLRLEATSSPFASHAMESAASLHGGELLAAGYTIAQVVHDYGDICQAITEIAVEQHAPISVEEFHTLNRCLDSAIAEAVTEHARLTAQKRSNEEAVHLGHAAHDLRDLLNAALLAFRALTRGGLANADASAILGRSLTGLQDLVDGMLSEVRLVAAEQRRERLRVAAFIEQVAATGRLHSSYRGIRFTVTSVDSSLTIDGDPQLLNSAVMNLLHNAFKNTRPGGAVVLRILNRDDRLLIEIQDECGGLPDRGKDLFRTFGNRRGKDRSGLGLGLSMARQAVRAHGGDIQVQNKPGEGCIFTIELPLAVEPVGAAADGDSYRPLG